MQIRVNNWRDNCEPEFINDRLSIFYAYMDPGNSSFADDVIRGLSATQKWLHAKYFYDAYGSDLFEKICTTREYYVTRTETSILSKFSSKIIDACSTVESVTELGSGASVKTRFLIDSSISQRGYLHYLPIDVSSILIESSRSLIKEIPELRISGIISEYENGINIANEISPEPKLLIFLGSSIGNFDFEDSRNFIRFISENMLDEDRLLVGFDLSKDVNVLNAAYNDSEGITAEFNMNLLTRMNRELGSNFDRNKFRHRAYFNAEKSRIEMHLDSLEDQKVRINGNVFKFRKGESIHTENSYKFTKQMIGEIASFAGLKILSHWTDEKDYFSEVLFSRI